MKPLLFIVVFVWIASATNAQTKTCTCESNFEWVKKTFEENDAGFQYIIDKKGQAAYDIHNQLTLKKIKSAKTLAECTELLSEWLRFFRSGHIGIVRLTNEIPNLPTTDKKDWNIDIPQFEKYISEKKEADFEGIWKLSETGKSRVGIKKEGANYVAFSMDTTKPLRVILTIKQDITTYYALHSSPYKIPNPKLIGNNTLQFGEWGTWKRVSPVFPDNEILAVDESYARFLTAKKPYLEELNATTLYFRITSLRPEHKVAIDSILTTNRDKILSTENLIIDIRNGTGGTDVTYQEILPYLYTNPIRMTGIEFLSTELNNQHFLDLLESPEYAHIFDEETKRLCKLYHDTLQMNLGKFALGEKEVYVYKRDTIYEYPKNVGIIINNKTVSSDEKFLLDVRQSKKVKTFGIPTFGALDISNVNTVDSPCGEFQLTYGKSRRQSMLEMPIDEIGIQPDYFIDKSIPSHQWVEFVNEILNQ